MNISLFDKEDQVLNAQPEQGYDIVLQLGVASNNLDTLYQAVANVRASAPRAAYYCLSQYTNDRTTVPFTNGLVKELPEISVIATRHSHLKRVIEHMSLLVGKIEEHTKRLSQKSFLPLFNSTSEKSKRIEEATKRAVATVDQYIAAPNPNLAEAISLLFTSKTEDKESLMDAYSYNSFLFGGSDNTQKEIVEFIKTTFNIDIAGDVVDESSRKAAPKRI